MNTLVLALSLLAAEAPEELRARLVQTWGAAADWLVTQQDASGFWKMEQGGQASPSPSYTGLIVTGLANAPAELKDKYKGAVAKGVDYLLSKVNADGSVGEGPTGGFLKTYATAIALMAFSSAERTSKVSDAVRGAQAYLKNNQMKEGINRGGSGYGDDSPTIGKDGKPTTKKGVANMSTTGFTAEALERSGLPKDDEFWKLVVEFCRRCQNSTEVNKDPEFMAALKAKGMGVGNDGGLYYGPFADPAMQKAGVKKIADKDVIVSYGAMTYDGLKTYLYAGLKKDSPEVTAAMDWVRKNYSLEAHPGFAFDAVQRHQLRGLYHYYMVMARALDAYGERPLETFDGKKHDWPVEMSERLLKVVQESKMWKNENPGWYEGDPVLVTSYVLTTCDVLFRYIK
ncbi:MAG TPA: prenyltransferase/squalene oxidase repeat-containing protein [Planctomycetota bacterium]